jgi:hypothetical protein
MSYDSYSQSVNEEEMFSLPEGTTADAWSLVNSGNNGKPAYVNYDAAANKYSILYDGKESGEYEFISGYDIKFDSRGNYYVLASEVADPNNYTYNYILLVNGDSVASFLNAESYNAMVTKDDEYKFTVKTSLEPDATSKIITYTVAGGLSESEEYAFVKPVYRGNAYYGDHGDDMGGNNFFVDKNGNSGYIVSDGITATILLGSDVIRTEYTDIDPGSFGYDNNGVLTYIAKIGGQFYVAPGNEFVVQGDKRYQSFDNVYSPVYFTSKNEPVYVGVEIISEYSYNSFLVIGDQRQEIYLDKDKKEKITGFTGGLYDIQVDDKDNITYYGSFYEEIKDSKEGSFTNTAYVLNNVAGKFYNGLGQWKFNSTGEGLATYNPDKDYYSMALLHLKDGKIKELKGSKFTSILDYGFTNTGKIYYTAMKEGNYETKIKPEYYVYIDNLLIGKYETILFQGYGDSYSSISFDGQGKYAFAVSTFNYYEEGEVIDPSAYVITSSGKQDPRILSADAKKDFNFIDFMFFTSNNRLFYFGGINDSPNNKYYSEMVIDGNNMDKVYTGVANINYDKLTNKVTFAGARGNKVYNVTVSF